MNVPVDYPQRMKKEKLISKYIQKKNKFNHTPFN